MKRMPRIFSLLALALAVGLFRFGGLSCGGASPPAGIPAPVSNLMSIGNPDGSGTVTVTGAPGAVNPGASVLGDNLSGGMASSPSFFIRSAWAEPAAFASSTIAGIDGSFQLRLTAAVGDTLLVSQSVDQETSLPTQMQVSGNVVSLGAKPQGLGIDSLTHQAYVTGSQDSKGFVFSLPLNSVTPLLSSPAATFTLQGKDGIGDVDVDEDMGKVFAVAPMENSFVRFPFSTEMSIADLTLSSPLDIDIEQSLHLAVIGLADSSVSFAMFNTEDEVFTCDFLIPSPESSSNVATPLVEVETDANGNLQIITVSQYQNDRWAVSRIQFSGCPTGFAVTGQVLLPSGALPRGLAAFDTAGQALVTDAAGNQVLFVDFESQSLGAAIPVGASPAGVAVNSANNHAYVVNSGDNSVTSIELQSLTTATREAIGLNPTEIAVDSALGLAVVLSSLDQSTVLFDTNF